MKLPISRVNIVFAHDVTMAAISFPVALYLRIGEGLWEHPHPNFAMTMVLWTACAALVFRVMGLYRGLWRYASANDLVAITRAVTLAILVFLPLTFVTTRMTDLPRSMMVINWLVLMVFLGAPRFGYRLFKDGRFGAFRSNEPTRIPALLIGAGDGADLFIRAMAHEPTAHYRVVGVLDTESARVGWHIHGVEVVGHIGNDLPQILAALDSRGDRPQRLIITSDELRGERVARLLTIADQLGIPLSRLPKITEFKSGRQNSSVIEVRPIAIEDLLNRPQTVLDRDGMRELITGKRILVTGAGGSIGSELVRQIAELAPSRLVLVDNSEFALYSIDLEMRERHADLARFPMLADVRDRAKIDRVFDAEKPEIVFHAAALKHVPMVEAHPTEGVLTNVLGTRNIADACRSHGVRTMVMISTDKAVNPTNVMGATKRVAEGYCQSLDIVEGERDGGTRFVTVRFGNVLGSTGSVVPLFQKQLARGGPITVTHPDMERYFMTIREAVELVLQAFVLRHRDAHDPGGRLFVLDMGDPVKIVELARQMIRLAGLRPEHDVKIVYTGLRPGEKLYEELFHNAEPLMPTAVKGIQLASPRTADHAVMSRAIDGLIDVATRGDSETTVARLRVLVPEYAGATPSGTEQRAQST
jgi:FlaA1/EpsC-like NDP-sugar epimerase